MPWEHFVLIAIAGLWAGTINTVVGSGTLVTFPVLVTLGYPPVTATTSNAIGLISGSFTGAWGYRHELTGMKAKLIRYGIASLLGAITGAVLLLVLPHTWFEQIVPFLIGFSVLLVVIQPWLTKRMKERRTATESAGPLLYGLIFAVGIYGGYFTAAQGIMLVAVLGLFLSDPLQRLNGIKNVLAAIVNLVAGVLYAFLAPVNWWIVLTIALSSIVGGLLGAKFGRKLPPMALRGLIVVIGVAAIVYMVFFQ
ncbi:sulfite exporter TauE/SafE family protein [Naumannella halotolerans]|uniref:Probable membrane transporter protein n=1 Tax=Naumannella halotolerans TaxID=993414 RepID=A0A4R7J177_9ACTN|nr:sulfite exporter TauE/SafE family protein [Naumannella halotolerans]TDT29999.1 hypothetical protein CLV29_3022 [Naumannella halotolerans]